MYRYLKQVTINIETDKGFGFIKFISKSALSTDKMIISFRKLCGKTFEWFKIKKIDSIPIDPKVLKNMKFK